MGPLLTETYPLPGCCLFTGLLLVGESRKSVSRSRPCERDEKGVSLTFRPFPLTPRRLGFGDASDGNISSAGWIGVDGLSARMCC
ncbi:unnamed protein product [Protopolystoma xenopodis]|uniref:Uncharacterized protein n=1 Tax=Protopolystoma xenopodis TaxID=117903 RepID=A0A448X958_9PLAT|nr:unnamed protein product [Protopolystoma xenopodis]